jgi:hypothetical protein
MMRLMHGILGALEILSDAISKGSAAEGHGWPINQPWHCMCLTWLCEYIPLIIVVGAPGSYQHDMNHRSLRRLKVLCISHAAASKHGQQAAAARASYTST